MICDTSFYRWTLAGWLRLNNAYRLVRLENSRGGKTRNDPKSTKLKQQPGLTIMEPVLFFFFFLDL